LAGVSVAIAIAALGTRLAAPAPRAQALTNCDVADLTIDAEEQAFLGLINQYRAGSGAPPLAISQSLNRASSWMSNDMAVGNYLSHFDRLNRDPFKRMADCDVTGNYAQAENVAAGYETAALAFEGWKNSPPHNANMLNAGYRSIGIARVYNAGASYGWYWTTNFSSEVAPVAQPGQLTACNTPGLAWNPPGNSISAGASIVFTASARCGGTPVYKWWIGTVGGGGAITWSQARAYSTSGTFVWSPFVPGSYYVAVWMENQGAPDNTYDVDSYTPFTVSASGCASVSFTAAPNTSSIRANTSQTFTATSTCAGTPVYRWWVWSATTGWVTAQPYSASNTFTWTPTAPGSYNIAVWVEPQGSSPSTYERDFVVERTVTP
jgi:uncharacterized protein YkwD